MNLRQIIAAAALAACAISPEAHAQERFPQRPVTLVVPSAPGGTTDFTARLIADGLTRALGQPVIVDNKPGAAGNIGNQFVAKAKPDGYTLLVAYSGYQVGNPHLFAKAGWDPIKDFVPVAMLTRAPQVIVAREGLPVNSLADLIAYARANPGKLNFASSGNGSIQHIAGELFKQVTATAITHVPYKGAGPAVQDLLGGQVDLFITTPAAVVSQVKAGKLKALAVTGTARLSALPQVPTAVEAGLKGFTLDSWFALYAPAGTPAEVVQLLNSELSKILSQPDTRRKADESGTTVEQMTPAQLGDYTRKELDYWGKIIKSAKISAE
ncbi:MAG: tripartite tricarboxylate transporter substrate binding protein [Burkholderiales bacterium]|nr:tripartite tricarboxylate transporter substrate binding protein [Burkholderiales bacterium]